MKKLNISMGVFFIALNLLWPGSISAQETCKIQIEFPSKGTKVDLKGSIRGTAVVPPGMHLWVFAQREGQHNWWPQGGGHVKVKGSEGKWVVDTTYGDESDPSKDKGANFNITAVILEDESRLVNYVEDTLKTGRYPGVELPAAPSGGCSVKENDEVTVTRK
jgi:hypothetical protein